MCVCVCVCVSVMLHACMLIHRPHMAQGALSSSRWTCHVFHCFLVMDTVQDDWGFNDDEEEEETAAKKD